MSRKYSATVSKPNLQNMLSTAAEKRGRSLNAHLNQFIEDNCDKSETAKATDCCNSSQWFVHIGLYKGEGVAELAVKAFCTEGSDYEVKEEGVRKTIFVTYNAAIQVCMMSKASTGDEIRGDYILCRDVLHSYLKRQTAYEKQKLERLLRAADKKTSGVEAELQAEKETSTTLKAEVQTLRDSIQGLEERLARQDEQRRASYTLMRDEFAPLIAKMMRIGMEPQ